MEALGETIALSLPEDCVLALHGNLGSGKTTFVRGLARGFGISNSVTSPTFNILHIHRGRRTLLHLDAYRLDHPSAWDDLFIEDLLESPWCLAVEWPEKLGPLLPPPFASLYFSIGEDPDVRLVSRQSPGSPSGF